MILTISLFIVSIVFIAVLIAVILILRIVVSIFLNISITANREESPEVNGEHVMFKTGDGCTLHGYFIFGKNSGGKTILFCHEVGAGWGSWHKYASYLPDAGFNVMSFDFRGHGESTLTNGYKPTPWFTCYEYKDIIAALEYIASRPDVDPAKIGIFGVSRGGSAAIYCAKKTDLIKAIAVDSTFSTYETMYSYITKWAPIYIPIKRISPSVIHFLTRLGIIGSQFATGCRFPRVAKALKKLRIPIFFIHGEKDNYISVDQARKLYSLANEPKDLWTIPRARHNESVLINPEEYAQRITEFFNKSFT